MLEIPLAVAGRNIVVWTHDGPHIDEVLSVYLVEQYGDERFLSKYCPDNILRIGCEGGELDEHARNGSPRKGDHCAATLVAKALGVYDDPSLESLLRYVQFTDTSKPRHDKHPAREEYAHPYALDQLIKLRNRRFAKFPEEFDSDPAVVFRMNLYDVALFHWDKKMFNDAWQDVAKAKRFKLTHNGRDIVVLMGTSNNEAFSKAARARYHADVVVQRESSGHVHIFTRTGSNVQLGDLIQMLNIMEQEKDGGVRITAPSELRREGSIDGGRWHYLPSAGQIHNSTESYPDVPASRLSDAELEFCVTTALQTALFDPQRAERCRQGQCSSRGVRDCPLDRFNLVRCCEIRIRQNRLVESK